MYAIRSYYVRQRGAANAVVCERAEDKIHPAHVFTHLLRQLGYAEVADGCGGEHIAHLRIDVFQRHVLNEQRRQAKQLILLGANVGRDLHVEQLFGDLHRVV